jgi:hypothetical protein
MRIYRRSLRWWCSVLVLAGSIVGTAGAADKKKKDDKNEVPAVLIASPFSVLRGQANTIRLRGLKLSEASAVRLEGAGAPIAAVIKDKGKAEPIKPFDAPKVGDTQIELEVTVPEDVTAHELSLIVTTPAGDTAPQAIVVLDSGTTVKEKEPNGGFRDAQEIEFGKTIRGKIEDAADVDVFKFRGKVGEQIIAEVDAARHGSPLDSLLTLYDEMGHELASNDDSEAGTDSILKFKIPSDGVYFLSLSDANGSGSAVHSYHLSLRDAASAMPAATKPDAKARRDR